MSDWEVYAAAPTETSFPARREKIKRKLVFHYFKDRSLRIQNVDVMCDSEDVQTRPCGKSEAWTESHEAIPELPKTNT